MTDFEDAIRLAQEAVAMAPEDHPDRARCLNDLRIALINRFRETGAMVDIDETIQVTQKLINITPEDCQNWARYSIALGILLSTRFLNMGEISDLDRAIQLQQKAVDLTPKDCLDRVTYLDILAFTLDIRYSRIRADYDLENAIQFGREAIDITPAGHQDRAKRLNDLGIRFGDRHLITGVLSDINEAIRLGREAVNITSKDNPDRAKYLNVLGNQLSARYVKTGVISDLDEAIQVGQDAVNMTPEDHPDRPGRLSNLAATLRQKHIKTGQTSDIDEAIRLAREAVAMMPEDHPDRAKYLIVLGNQLSARSVRIGAISDLDEAIRIGQDAINVTPENHPDRATYLGNFAVMLDNKYLKIGAMSDLEVAIQIGREVVDITPAGHPNQAGHLNNLGNRYSDRYSRTRAMADLDEAIQLQQKAVDLTPKDCLDQAMYLNNLAATLGERYLRTGAISDLEVAIQLGREALVITPADHQDRAKRLNNHGIRLGNRYSKTGAMSDLNEAIQLGREAVNMMSENHPERAGCLNDLGIRLGNRYSETGETADLEDALTYHQSALCQPNSSTITRILAGREAFRHFAIISNWQKAYEVSDIALHLLPELTSRSLENSDKQHILGQVVGLASDAAAASLHAGKGPSVALNLLEQGRGVIAASLEEIRMDILDLQERYPKLAELFLRLRDELELPVTRSTSLMDGNGEISMQVQMNRRYEAGKRLEKLIGEIREQPGFKDFLLAPSGSEMLAAAKYGPIVIINVSEYRCDAILVEQHQIRSLALPDLHSKEINKKAQVEDLRSLKLLEWLWDVVTNPILKTLGFTEPPSDESWPHIWWIPTGPLSKFPLHAAGHHSKGSSETVLDRVMSSYSSSVKAIIHSRRRPNIFSTPAQALLVAMEHTPGSSRLPFATKEVDMLHGICKAMSIDPIEPGRSKQIVTSQLPQCKIFHFAGHGHTDKYDPSRSYLLLEDGKDDPLMVATLLAMNIREHSPFLAYLSACGTGRITDERFVDESIHLISSFQLAGFRHVIGTLWEVNDELCVDMARITYETLRNGGITDENVCRGLHNATRELRDRWLNRVKSGDRPLRDIVLCDGGDGYRQGKGSLHWVPYVHFGV
ncbi:uncharacterized protein GIQ15_04291 [Arthroderma uncinatum]|uniref:uncharacterized protein n=1 Tax=Arthroderma uncinatum TaxID=74035 RepID=UPI00144AE929|nr:uncharacterized protein GIQ15_04291 [Arthroderma uncinatum]KAF3481532.1 hypothetical protein GIQ15_04291 [Arthroderma uncinatum]